VPPTGRRGARGACPPYYKGAEELLVVGGGNSGLEGGMFLSQFADRIRAGSTKQLGSAVGEGIARPPSAVGGTVPGVHHAHHRTPR
jgi:hypothetical protein